jgi:beta-aspartyl-peptidase (threonine type)
MRFPFLIISIFTLLTACSQPKAEQTTPTTETNGCNDRPAYAMVIHGGAGTILRENLTEEKEKAIRDVLKEALNTGEAILQNGGSSMDAVIATINVMENSEHFNAGKGAVFTHEGINELDASIMNGENLNAGAVGGVTIVKNPINAARAVMENSKHVMLSGAGANTFAIEQGLDTVSGDYFYTESRYKSLQKAIEKENKQTGSIDTWPDYKYGTVGCVALDKNGNIVAGTSTGGMTNKRWNRIGDAPIIGAGTYANNKTCGVSCTGHGEYFIRYAVAHDMSALMDYKGVSVEEAGKMIIHQKLKEAGGSGGLIALDKCGNITMPFNTAGMYRGYTKPGERVVEIYEE